MKPASPTTDAQITWHRALEPLPGDPIATVALDRGAWEARGASFFDGEDPIGGVTRIANGVAKLGELVAPFAVVDHDEDTTFVVAADDASDAVLDALVAVEAVSEDAVLERLPVAHDASIEERMDDLESRLTALNAQLEGVTREAAAPHVAHVGEGSDVVFWTSPARYHSKLDRGGDLAVEVTWNSVMEGLAPKARSTTAEPVSAGSRRARRARG
jgi:hypothetical protein